MVPMQVPGGVRRPPGPRVGLLGVTLAVAGALAALAGWTAAVAAGSPTTSLPAGPAPTTGSGGATGASPGIATNSSWTVYHGVPLGTGVAGVVDLTGARQVFASPSLKGQLYGEPLEWNGRVYVATTADDVYALSATTGAVRWSVHVGTAVPSSDLPCGDISPTVGIVGTPVIDPARAELFAVADELVGGTPAHHLIGVDLTTGTVVLNQDVDPPGAVTADILQRTGLNLDGGRVVFGFGGNDGDCAQYHGWVESVPEAGGTPDLYEVDAGAGQSQGAVWMGGAAPEVDAAGHVWVATGNGSVHQAAQGYDGSDSVVKLTAAMTKVGLFAPTSWAQDNADDYDLGSSAPAVLPDGLAVQEGKSHRAYLLDADKLGGVGGQLATLTDACDDDVDGGDAVSRTGSGLVVYLPCLSGVVALSVQASPPALHVLWQTSTGSSGPPIVAGGLVWTIDRSGAVYGLDPATGDAVETLGVGAEANHFPTPSVGAGLLLVPSASNVVAFAGTGTPAGAAATTTVPAAPGGRHAASGGSGAATAATVPAARPRGRKQGEVAVVASVLGLVAMVVVLAVVIGRIRRPGQDPPRPARPPPGAGAAATAAGRPGGGTDTPVPG